MLKLSLEKVVLPRVQPYFEISHWNIPKDSMKTYTKNVIETSDLSIAKRYLTHLFLLKEKIKNQTISVKDLKQIIKQNTVGTTDVIYVYEIDEDLSIELSLENEYKNPEIKNIDLYYAKYYDEYGVEYDIKIEEISELLKKF